MEWFFNWLDALMKNLMIDSLISRFQWIDWAVFIFLVLGIIYGLQTGLMYQIAEILQIMIVIFVVHEFYDHVALFMRQSLAILPAGYEGYYDALGFIVTAIVVWVSIGLLFYFMRKFFHTTTSEPMRSIGGFILGCIHLIIILSFISQAVLLMPLRKANRVFEKGGSYSGVYLRKLSPSIHELMREPLALVLPEKQDKK